MAGKNQTKFIFFFFSVLVFFSPCFALADSQGQSRSFFVNTSYDLLDREKISATLEKVSQNAYFYLENNWSEKLNQEEREEVVVALDSLSREFDNNIYPKLTAAYGSEWKAGIDNDSRITILFHQMKNEAAGYFRSEDQYFKAQSRSSNEREIIYLNIGVITEKMAKSYISHEFTHLITFNQKERLRGVTEDVWLNEARAEYAPTLLGYDNDYQGSNLQQRVRQFIQNPSDSLTEWQNKTSDYGVVNLFIQYLAEHYGVETLTFSLQSSKTGISSINEALKKRGVNEDFSQVFTDWTIAVLINDCGLSKKYCYFDSNLNKLKILPQTNFLPLSGESSLSVVNTTKDWAGNWQKIIGGKDSLKLEFKGNNNLKFKIPYLVEDANGKITIDFLQLDTEQKGTIYVSGFSTKNKSLIIVPSIQNKTSDFSDSEPSYQFSFVASTVKRTPTEEEAFIQQLLVQIDFLKKEIARVQAELDAALASKKNSVLSCKKLEKDLYFGIKDSTEVRCLQQFLKNQGSEIYPEGLVTGNFLQSTQTAVIRFQEKYASEILVPAGLEKGTGFVGPLTRQKINQSLAG